MGRGVMLRLLGHMKLMLLPMLPVGLVIIMLGAAYSNENYTD